MPRYLDDFDRLFSKDDAEAYRHQRAVERERVERRRLQFEEQDRRRAEAARATRDKLATEEVERDYRQMGLQPVRRSDGVLVSLALLMRLGWTIQDVGTSRVLVAPPTRQKPEPREELGR